MVPAQTPPITGTNRSSREVQVLKLLFRNSHWVDNLCQCEGNSVDPPENQRLRIDSRLRGYTGEICLNGWVTCLSKKRSLHQSSWRKRPSCKRKHSPGSPRRW